MASPTIAEYAGVSLDLWQPNEEIYHANLNIRERRFGGLYQTDTIGTSQLAPIFTDVPQSFLFGSFKYGFGQFNFVAGAGLVTDTITTGEIAPTYISASASIVFNTGNKFGFAEFNSSFLTDTITSNEIAPIFVSGVSSGVFGSSVFFGFLAFGSNIVITDTVTTGTTTPIFTSVTPLAKFGSFQFGFGQF